MKEVLTMKHFRTTALQVQHFKCCIFLSMETLVAMLCIFKSTLQCFVAWNKIVSSQHLFWLWTCVIYVTLNQIDLPWASLNREISYFSAGGWSSDKPFNPVWNSSGERDRGSSVWNWNLAFKTTRYCAWLNNKHLLLTVKKHRCNRLEIHNLILPLNKFDWFCWMHSYWLVHGQC